MKTEIIIVKNPFFYKDVAPNAFQATSEDGSWIPLVFQAVETVVNRHFMALCELDWDYLRNDQKLSDEYFNYKGVYHRGLDNEQRRFAESVANEIEAEIRAASEDVLAAKESDETE